MARVVQIQLLVKWGDKQWGNAVATRSQVTTLPKWPMSDLPRWMKRKHRFITAVEVQLIPVKALPSEARYPVTLHTAQLEDDPDIGRPVLVQLESHIMRGQLQHDHPKQKRSVAALVREWVNRQYPRMLRQVLEVEFNDYGNR